MKFLSDENISPVIVEELRKTNHDVFDLKEKKLRGISDNDVAILAEKEKRVILTHDSTFINVINPTLKIRMLLISFKQKEATRERMQMIGWFIGDKAKYIFDRKTRIHLKLEADNLKIFPLA